jgi:apolipoprotein N-acyltransferase
MVADTAPLVPWVEVLGVLGLGAIVCANCLATARLVVAPQPRRVVIYTLIVLVIAALGALRARLVDAAGHVTLGVTVVQEQAPRDRENASRKAMLRERVAAALAATGGRLLLLPENALYDDALGDSDVLSPAELAMELGKVTYGARVALAGVQFGLPRRDGLEPYRASVCAVDARGVTGVRDKRYGAPIGEEAPFSGIPMLAELGRYLTGRTDFAEIVDGRGDLELAPDLRAAVCLCFEHMFPDIWVARPIAGEIDVMVCVSNVSWFGYSTIERAQSRAGRRLLAIQERRPLLYVANGGSEWFDALGRLHDVTAPESEWVEWQITIPDRGSATWPSLRWVRALVLPTLLVAALVGMLWSRFTFSS